MPEEVLKVLGPWPILQMMFGVAILAGGVFMIVKGLRGGKDTHVQLEDKRLEWQAYEHLRSIEENTARIADNQRVMLEHVRGVTDQLKALSAAIWNRGV